MNQEPAFIDDRALAKWLGVSLYTVRGWRARGRGGPTYRRFGRKIRYATADVVAWIEASKVTPPT